ncbi:hypothetical protein NEF87_003493 [Candidatus Lokiarchaeum ossiferum]|uniref:HTH arsR-type domain-containing protein n=1 Tax=Candidatus Lokiarchaeum ossiferum TaxID=2951803 RepID=A0ABY6HV32_9ARCH|nr:hypothetical protein NEF87_003493 [Candidatus Lokiarchaeum sp. B-35]
MEDGNTKRRNSPNFNSPEDIRSSDANEGTFIPAEDMIITDPNVIPSFTHEKKQILLEILLTQEKTIMELSTATGMNPGTVKRHISELQKYGVVVVARTQINKKRILLKYYRTSALHFTFHFEWPGIQ